ncbi:MAG: Lrp/AsnC family transcriptional regulator [Desulfobacterales bacterium]|nr:Lrp/AsnC family transcriptional regulator [Desulfobacterales bacterium]
MLSELEKKIISILQDDLPICQFPYKEIATKLKIDENTLLEHLQSLCDRKIIRRFGATLRHQISGFTANAMVAWKVPEQLIEELGQKLSEFQEITHCYHRITTPTWPYNLYTMVHAADKNACEESVQKIAKQIGIYSYTILYSCKELKKTSMHYFPIMDYS